MIGLIFLLNIFSLHQLSRYLFCYVILKVRCGMTNGTIYFLLFLPIVFNILLFFHFYKYYYV